MSKIEERFGYGGKEEEKLDEEKKIKEKKKKKLNPKGQNIRHLLAMVE